MLKKVKVKYDLLPIQMKASFWFFVCAVLQRGISVITTPIFTRLLSTTDYGRYSVFYSWLSIVTVIVTMNLFTGVFTMGIVKFREEEKVFTSSLQGLTITLCLAWTIIYLLFREFWNSLFKLTTVQMLAMLIMIWASASFSFWMTTERNRFRYKRLVLITLIVSILKPVISIIFVLNSNDKATARILGIALVELVCYSGFSFAQIATGKVFFSSKFWKYAILFNLPLIPHYLSGVVLAGADKIMIQRMVGESEAGIYGLAYSLAQIMLIVNESLNKTMSPWLYQKIRDRKFESMERVVVSSLIFVAACNILLIAIAPELLFLFAPREYSEAIYTIVPVALSGFFSYLYLCFAPFEFYYEKRIWTTVGTLVGAILNVILNYLLIPKFGYVAAGYTTLLCSAILGYTHMYFMKKVCDNYLNGVRPYRYGMFLALSICSTALGMAFVPVYEHRIIRYLLLSVIVIIIFLFRKKIEVFIRRDIIQWESK
ncbi:oligosaccharide flippase family protein [Butyrivibrio sp. FCS014]|uniref:oligosaccharide flippase family protein n=1 Tax=Butyrivibrio sp. FCS014 TaxID=1408304 RepID=UPI0004639E44|nr:oligosaccharide flippase family protein [Butyrivibrio sp. FCS014]